MNTEIKPEHQWQEIESAPRNATWVQVKMRDGTIHRAHWACDLSGEDQPAFRGWFVAASKPEYGFVGIDEPVAWRPE